MKKNIHRSNKDPKETEKKLYFNESKYANNATFSRYISELKNKAHQK